MKRRDFINLIAGSAGAWPFFAFAQRTALPLIGVLRNTSQSDSAFRLAAFRAGLSELGFIEGTNVAIEFFTPTANTIVCLRLRMN
jgi:putative ABC transport system substrate-binding protein